MNFFRRTPSPTFTYGERVRVIEGFYREQVGTVTAETYRREYRVTLDAVGESRWFVADSLARLSDEEQPPHVRKIVMETAHART